MVVNNFATFEDMVQAKRSDRSEETTTGKKEI
jgi:hypothetical protein